MSHRLHNWVLRPGVFALEEKYSIALYILYWELIGYETFLTIWQAPSS
jgi:hypothetical protein